MARLNGKIRDYSDEYGQFGIATPDIVGVDTWSVLDTRADDFATHVDAHSLGTIVDMSAKQNTQASNDVRPASPFAQRELGFRFYLRDTVNQKLGSFTIPAADMAIGSVVAGQDELDLSAAPTAALVAWIEANAESIDGNAVTVERALVVGRNS